MTIRAVLWDADGVLQRFPSSWQDALGEVVGSQWEEFGARLWADLDDALRGRLGMEERITAVLAELDLTERREQVLAVWERFEPVQDARELVAAVRAGGTLCVLASNQDLLRASNMRLLMGYDTLLDAEYYSCDLGLAKPEPAYFHAIADDLGLAHDHLLFIDDHQGNVEGARAAGLRAETWHYDHGIGVLREHLATYAVL